MSNNNSFVKKTSFKNDLYEKKSSKNDEDYVKKSSVKNDEDFVKKSLVKNDENFTKDFFVKNDDDLYVKKPESKVQKSEVKPQKEEYKSKKNNAPKQNTYGKKYETDEYEVKTDSVQKETQQRAKPNDSVVPKASTNPTKAVPNKRKEESIPERRKVEGNSVVILTFNASPGMGKTHFVDFLQKNIDRDIHVQVVKSDSIQAKAFAGVADSEQQGNSFELKKKLYTSNFKSSVLEMCQSLKPGLNLLIIDKCSNGPMFLKN